jgi:purine-nucleoside phosphorylase
MAIDQTPAATQVELVGRAVTEIRRRTHIPPRVGLILGSGLGALADDLDRTVEIPFSDLPGFPELTVQGHSGTLVIGELARRRVVMMRGRAHFYEGHTMAAIAFPVRVLAALGCNVLVVTNSAGGLNSDYRSGDLMAITDHIFLPGLAGVNPLVNWQGSLNDRFVDMAKAYDPGLRAQAIQIAADLGVTLHQGVYVMVGGPSYETPAEQRLLRLLGGDAVGMSTAPEVVVARQCGLRVLGLSLITNPADGQTTVPVSHSDVVDQAARAGPAFRALVTTIVAHVEMPDDGS